jgi:hypothetical protein
VEHAKNGLIFEFVEASVVWRILAASFDKI